MSAHTPIEETCKLCGGAGHFDADNDCTDCDGAGSFMCEFKSHAILLAERDRAQANEKRALDDLTACEAERDALLVELKGTQKMLCEAVCQTSNVVEPQDRGRFHVSRCHEARAILKRGEGK